jgi:hypothetical protein
MGVVAHRSPGEKGIIIVSGTTGSMREIKKMIEELEPACKTPQLKQLSRAQ